MEIFCGFCFCGKNLYTCSIEKADIIEKEHVIKEFKGIHQTGKANKDVKSVCFLQSANVNHFPRDLNKHFPNLNELIINGSGIKEISKNDLKGLEGLDGFWIVYGELTSLPDDLFTAMPNLRSVSFAGNKIEFASSGILKTLLGRENVKVDFRGNKRINAFFKPGQDGSLGSLDEMMKLLDEKCSEQLLPIVISGPVDFSPKFKELWQSGKFSDLTIIAEDKKFKVHKVILGMQSEVLYQAIEDKIDAKVMRIPGFSWQTVGAFLRFLYTNEISDDGNPTEKFEIADFFKVEAMKLICEKIIYNQIDETNAWETFLFAHRFSSQILKKKAFQWISRNIPDDLPDTLMEDPKKLKKLIKARRNYVEILENSRNELDSLKKQFGHN